MFSLRIVTVDHYLSPPIPGLDVSYSDFRCSHVKQVPVIRVFGSTPGGQKTCLHLHGIFPYVCVPYYTGCMNGDDDNQQYLHQVAVSLDRAINISLGQGPLSDVQHVYKVSAVSGIPFYGYHSNEGRFLKIYLYNPSLVKRAVELLQNGAVMNKSFQPHEAHIPFVLQVFIDYNLYGMNLINLASVKFRRKTKTNLDVSCDRSVDLVDSLSPNSLKLPAACNCDDSKLNNVSRKWSQESIPNSLLLPEEVEFQSVCELEVDALAIDIVNRVELLSNPGMNPGLKCIWEDEQQRRRKLGKDSQPTPVESQDRPNLKISHYEFRFLERLKKKLADDDFPFDEKNSSVDERRDDSVIVTQNRVQEGLQDKKLTEPKMDGDIVSSLSQNSIGGGEKVHHGSSILDSQDDELIDKLANLLASDRSVLEEGDSILCPSQKPTDKWLTQEDFYDGDVDVDERENLEMSQIWDFDVEKVAEPDVAESSAIRYSPVEKTKWSKWKSEAEKSFVGDAILPQVDGPVDPKSNNQGVNRSVPCWKMPAQIPGGIRPPEQSKVVCNSSTPYMYGGPTLHPIPCPVPNQGYRNSSWGPQLMQTALPPMQQNFFYQNPHHHHHHNPASLNWNYRDVWHPSSMDMMSSVFPPGFCEKKPPGRGGPTPSLCWPEAPSVPIAPNCQEFSAANPFSDGYPMMSYNRQECLSSMNNSVASGNIGKNVNGGGYYETQQYVAPPCQTAKQWPKYWEVQQQQQQQQQFQMQQSQQMATSTPSSYGCLDQGKNFVSMQQISYVTNDCQMMRPNTTARYSEETCEGPYQYQNGSTAVEPANVTNGTITATMVNFAGMGCDMLAAAMTSSGIDINLLDGEDVIQETEESKVVTYMEEVSAGMSCASTEKSAMIASLVMEGDEQHVSLTSHTSVMVSYSVDEENEATWVAEMTPEKDAENWLALLKQKEEDVEGQAEEEIEERVESGGEPIRGEVTNGPDDAKEEILESSGRLYAEGEETLVAKRKLDDQPDRKKCRVKAVRRMKYVLPDLSSLIDSEEGDDSKMILGRRTSSSSSSDGNEEEKMNEGRPEMIVEETLVEEVLECGNDEETPDGIQEEKSETLPCGENTEEGLEVTGEVGQSDNCRKDDSSEYCTKFDGDVKGTEDLLPSAGTESIATDVSVEGVDWQSEECQPEDGSLCEERSKLMDDSTEEEVDAAITDGVEFSDQVEIEADGDVTGLADKTDGVQDMVPQIAEKINVLVDMCNGTSDEKDVGMVEAGKMESVRIIVGASMDCEHVSSRVLNLPFSGGEMEVGMELEIDSAVGRPRSPSVHNRGEHPVEVDDYRCKAGSTVNHLVVGGCSKPDAVEDWRAFSVEETVALTKKEADDEAKLKRQEIVEEGEPLIQEDIGQQSVEGPEMQDNHLLKGMKEAVQKCPEEGTEMQDNHLLKGMKEAVQKNPEEGTEKLIHQCATEEPEQFAKSHLVEDKEMKSQDLKKDKQDMEIQHHPEDEAEEEVQHLVERVEQKIEMNLEEDGQTQHLDEVMEQKMANHLAMKDELLPVEEKRQEIEDLGEKTDHLLDGQKENVIQQCLMEGTKSEIHYLLEGRTQKNDWEEQGKKQLENDHVGGMDQQVHLEVQDNALELQTKELPADLSLPLAKVTLSNKFQTSQIVSGTSALFPPGEPNSLFSNKLTPLNRDSPTPVADADGSHEASSQRVPVLEKMATLVRMALDSIHGQELLTDTDQADYGRSKVDCNAWYNVKPSASNNVHVGDVGRWTNQSLTCNNLNSDTQMSNHVVPTCVVAPLFNCRYSPQSNGFLTGQRKPEQREKDPPEDEFGTNTKMRNIGTNVHPQDFLRQRIGTHYTVKYRGLRVSVSKRVHISDLRKLGKERVCLPKLIIKQNSQEETLDGAENCDRNGEDKQVLSTLSLKTHRKKRKAKGDLEVRQKNTEGGFPEGRVSPLGDAHLKNWTLQSNSSPEDGLKMRFKAQGPDKATAEKRLIVGKKRTSRSEDSGKDEPRASGNILPVVGAEPTSKTAKAKRTKPQQDDTESTCVAISRSKRVRVDYKPHAFSHIFKFDVVPDNNTSAKVKSEKNTVKTCPLKDTGKFKGCRAMKVQLERCHSDKESDDGSAKEKKVVKKKLSLKMFLRKGEKFAGDERNSEIAEPEPPIKDDSQTESSSWSMSELEINQQFSTKSGAKGPEGRKRTQRRSNQSKSQLTIIISPGKSRLRTPCVPDPDFKKRLRNLPRSNLNEELLMANMETFGHCSPMTHCQRKNEPQKLPETVDDQSKVEEQVQEESEKTFVEEQTVDGKSSLPSGSSVAVSTDGWVPFSVELDALVDNGADDDADDENEKDDNAYGDGDVSKEFDQLLEHSNPILKAEFPAAKGTDGLMEKDRSILLHHHSSDVGEDLYSDISCDDVQFVFEDKELCSEDLEIPPKSCVSDDDTCPLSGDENTNDRLSIAMRDEAEWDTENEEDKTALEDSLMLSDFTDDEQSFRFDKEMSESRCSQDLFSHSDNSADCCLVICSQDEGEDSHSRELRHGGSVDANSKIVEKSDLVEEISLPEVGEVEGSHQSVGEEELSSGSSIVPGQKVTDRSSAETSQDEFGDAGGRNDDSFSSQLTSAFGQVLSDVSDAESEETLVADKSNSSKTKDDKSSTYKSTNQVYEDISNDVEEAVPEVGCRLRDDRMPENALEAPKTDAVAKVDSSLSELSVDPSSGIESFYGDETPVGESLLDVQGSKTQSTITRPNNLEGSKVYVFDHKPPSRQEIEKSLKDYNIPQHRHQDAFYSKPEDLPSNKQRDLEFDGRFQRQGLDHWRTVLATRNDDPSATELVHQLKTNLRTKAAFLSDQRQMVIIPIHQPPSRLEVDQWVTKKKVPNGGKVLKHLKIPDKKLPDEPQKLEDVPQKPQEDPRPHTPVDLSLSRKLASSRLLHSTPSSRHVSPASSPLVTPIPRKRRSSELGRGAGNRKVKKRRSVLAQITEEMDISTKNRSVETIAESPIPMLMDEIEDGVSNWRQRDHQKMSEDSKDSSSSQIDGPTVANTHAFKVSWENLQDVRAVHEYQYLTVCSLEVHVQTRHHLHPDPQIDPICAVFYSIHNDVPVQSGRIHQQIGCIVVDPTRAGGICNCDVAAGGCASCRNLHRHLLARTGIVDVRVAFVPTERKLLEEVVSLVRRWDPDILVGYEIEMLSWGYLLRRSEVLKMNLDSELTRVPKLQNTALVPDSDNGEGVDEWEVKLKGRIVLNLWRLMRHEVNLTSYRFENVAYHLLHQRIPLYSFTTLTDWFDDESDLHRWRTIDHYVTRAHGNIQLMLHVDLIGRTSELARLFGIQFYEVLSRGSQFRVESMMLRLAKPANYVAVSPSIQQRAQMRAPECLALIMEPESKFYSNPVVVLDFQSLYPSMIIAYNYCYSTCLGHVDLLGGMEPYKFGCTNLEISRGELKNLINDINVSPSGVAFVNRNIRRGILPQMLEEILNTRIMVKTAMKEYKDDRSLRRVLDARQLGLKLIANVTYGYTAANYSGRMPCSEVGDSVVSKARETLQRAIEMVNENTDWDARVVYGDTDSLFVHLPGRSKSDAFRIGREIADAVTAVNPTPVKLKFEKVYLPCILQTKKRYVGYMYETEDQQDATFDAKGIETVRRDGCPAVVKVLEKSLRLLFTTRDLSRVKQFVQRQFQKVFSGRISLQDLTLAREYRGRKGYKPGACVPALEITRRLLREDRCAEPRVGERVPYVIVYGSPGQPLFHLVRQPEEVLTDPNLRVNAHYYVNNMLVPPLQRVFGLMGADVSQWFTTMSRSSLHVGFGQSVATKKGTISQYLTVLNCPVCGEPSSKDLCPKCRREPQNVVVTLNERIRKTERIYQYMSQICHSCTGVINGRLSCVSLDCPVFYRLAQATRDLNQVPYLRKQFDVMEF